MSTWIIQELKELDLYLDGLSQQTEKDAGNLWIQFSDKFQAFKKRLLSETPSTPASPLPIGIVEELDKSNPYRLLDGKKSDSWNEAVTKLRELIQTQPAQLVAEDLQKQVRDHIQKHNLFDWHEALTEEEMLYLENLLLTFNPLCPPGSIGFEEQKRHIQSFSQPPSVQVEQEGSFIQAIGLWMEWTVKNFPKSGAKASLIHLREELKETIEEMDNPASFQHNEGLTLMELADDFICLFTASGKSGFTPQQIFKAIINKTRINMYHRKWKENPDGTYSHIK